MNKHILLTCIIALLAQSNLFAQKAKKKVTRIRVEYFKNQSKEEILVATLRIKNERYIPFTDAEVKFFCLKDTSSILLGTAKTNKIGEAKFVLNGNTNIVKDSLGLITFEAKYIGTSLIKETKRKTSIKQSSLDISFFQKDTIKYIKVDFNDLSMDSQPVPKENLKINFYVKGTFSLYNFITENTDENGIAIVEFPVDMPGDTIGVLTIIAKIEENKLYGTIESRGNINWGKPVALVEEKLRGLGDTDAPLWMVYTLITLLSAVWFHYLYVIYLIIKIKLVKRSI